MFDEIYSAIVKKLTEGLRPVPVIAGYPETKKISKLPSVFFELTEFEIAKDADPMTGELNIDTRWEARAVFAPDNKDAHLKARWAAASIALLVHNETFVQNSLPAVVLRSSDDGIEKLISGHHVWVTEWAQVLRIGKSLWDEAGFYPENTHYPNSPTDPNGPPMPVEGGASSA